MMSGIAPLRRRNRDKKECEDNTAMGLPKGPSEGGSGGKRGHSGMEHWDYTEEIKEAARRRRRLEDKKAVEEARQHSNDSERA